MSFDRPRRATIPQDQPLPTGQRRTFLDLLRLELREAHGISSDVVRRAGQLVLSAGTFRPAAKSVDIGCDMLDDGWWFTWAADGGRAIAPVENATGTASIIARELDVPMLSGRYGNHS